MLHRHLLAASTHYIKLEQNNSKLFFSCYIPLLNLEKKNLLAWAVCHFPQLMVITRIREINYSWPYKQAVKAKST